MLFSLVFVSHHPGQSPLHSRYFAARAFSFTSFTSFASLTSSKSFTIRTSETPFPQPLYNPHLQAPLGSAGNKGLITPLESALTKNYPVSRLESALTKRWGVGVILATPEFATRHSSLPTMFKSFLFRLFQTLLHSSKTQLFCFHAIPDSLDKTPGGGGMLSLRILCAPCVSALSFSDAPFVPCAGQRNKSLFNLQLPIEDPGLVGAVNCLRGATNGGGRPAPQ